MQAELLANTRALPHVCSGIVFAKTCIGQSACMPDKDKGTARRLGWLGGKTALVREGKTWRTRRVATPAEAHRRTGWHGAARRPRDWTHAARWGKGGPPGGMREERGSHWRASAAKDQSHRPGISPALGLRAGEDAFAYRRPTLRRTHMHSIPMPSWSA